MSVSNVEANSETRAERNGHLITDPGAQPADWWNMKRVTDEFEVQPDNMVLSEFGEIVWGQLRDAMRDRLGVKVNGSTTFADLPAVPGDWASGVTEMSMTRAQVAEYAAQHGLDNPHDIAARLAADANLEAEQERQKVLALFGGAPLPLTVSTLPSFPTDALPPFYRAYTEALAASLEVGTAMTGAFIMGALSAAVGGCVEVQIQSDRRENGVTHQGIVATPGERKSPVIAAAIAPLLEAEEVLAGKVADDLPLLRIRAEVAAAKFAADKKKYIKDVIDGIATAPAQDAKTATDAETELLNKALMVPDVPTSPLIVYGGDITPEAVAVALADNDERAAIMDAEGGVFDKLTGMYNRGVANIDVVLAGHSGDRYAVRRKGSEPIILSRPALSMCIALQPSKLDQLRRHPDMMGRGIIARMSFVMAPKVPGRRGWADPVSPVTLTDYRASLRSLAVGLRGDGDPATKLVMLSDKALAEFRRIAERIQRRIESTDGDLSGPMEWWGSKYAGMIARLALHLHMAQHGADGLEDQIGKDTLLAAEEIGEFYAAHTRAAVGVVSAADGTTVDEMSSALGWLHTCREKGAEPTTTRFSSNVKPQSLRPADKRNAVLAGLANLHHVVVKGKAIILHPDSTRP